MDVADSAEIDPSAVIGPGCLIRNHVQVGEYARLGPDCVLGRGAYIGPGVVVGRQCTIQDYAVVYEPSLLEDGVFIGAAAVFTNDAHPRAINTDGTRRATDERDLVGVTVRTGASIGAHAVCVAPLTIGRWAMVAAGAVVTDDVHDYALVAGVPAQRIAWVGRSGMQLRAEGDGRLVCPVTGEWYTEHDGFLTRD
ncbi:acyltransferase [Cryobacterium sp. TMT3-29-2]|uniref:acyltransferase n=1 Tax=Cryobacterium sp. TMT3-29-2 TaxID=2555867 RepID=UPI0010744994|nr:acyltransferase [Cryobacterium sp. TMT3-29-2]TFC83457.1 N-acetyltransferase [Cryobacterium sp. TMT3-29-2]